MPTPIVTPLFNVAFGTTGAQTTSETFQNIPDLGLRITVPAGKRAGVVVWFSGMIVSDYSTEIRAIIDRIVMEPGVVQLLFQAQGGWNQSANFVTKDVLGAGTYRVRMQWRSGGQPQFGGGEGSQQQIFARTMIVLTTIV